MNTIHTRVSNKSAILRSSILYYESAIWAQIIRIFFDKQFRGFIVPPFICSHWPYQVSSIKHKAHALHPWVLGIIQRFYNTKTTSPVFEGGITYRVFFFNWFRPKKRIAKSLPKKWKWASSTARWSFNSDFHFFGRDLPSSTLFFGAGPVKKNTL